MSETAEPEAPIRAATRPQVPGRVIFDPLKPVNKPQEYFDEIKQKFAEARDLRLSYRPAGRAQYTSELTGDLAKYEIDPHVEEIAQRDPIEDSVEVLLIGGGLITLANVLIQFDR